MNRNPYDFVVLSGNVSNGDNTNAQYVQRAELTARGVGYSINGQRESGTEILLDGVENVAVFGVNAGQLVPQDSIQEFSIITNNYGAEYGRASGGIVNVDTKAGTNNFHGSAYEYNRLSAYTANTFANDVDGIPKGTYTRNQFGFNVGAPIIKNRLFVDFSEEFVRVRSAASQVRRMSLIPPLSVCFPPTPRRISAIWNRTSAVSGIAPLPRVNWPRPGIFNGGPFPWSTAPFRFPPPLLFSIP